MELRRMQIRTILLLIVVNCGFGMDVNDILSVDYMPGTWLMREAVLEHGGNSSLQHPQANGNASIDGDIKGAFFTMQFHRSKMNEYLCRNFVAEEILSELQGAQSRLGLPADRMRHRKVPPNHSVTKGKLLTDPGSTGYKDWLSRSTVLEDVYNHYDDQMSAAVGSQNLENGEYDSGEVTGYAVQQGGGEKDGYGVVGGPPWVAGGGSWPGGMAVAGGGESFTPPSGGGWMGPSSGHHSHDYAVVDEKGHGLAINDLFDLALTALAFLAFGLFVLNLIMTCMSGPLQGPTLIMTTTTTTTTTDDGGGGAGVAGGGGDGGRRMRRATAGLLREMDEVAQRVLASIEVMLELNGEEKEVGKPGCLQYALCRDNRHSRGLRSSSIRLWVPVWSFGVSWLSGQMYPESGALENLRAAALGLGNAECEAIYKC